MYQMWYGISLYEKAVKQAREDRRTRRTRSPRRSSPTLGASTSRRRSSTCQKAVEAQQGHVARPLLPRQDLPRRRTSRRRPRPSSPRRSRRTRASPVPYVALGELYRNVGLHRQAIKVASAGHRQRPRRRTRVSDIWYVLGMGYDDKANETTRRSRRSPRRSTPSATTTRRSSSAARRTSARATSPTPRRTSRSSRRRAARRVEFAKQQATKMLMHDRPPTQADEGSPGREEEARARRAQEGRLPAAEALTAGLRRSGSTKRARSRNRSWETSPGGHP